MRIDNIRLQPVEYLAAEGKCHGTNVLYELNGAPVSCRWPWVEASVAAAEQQIRRTLERSRKSAQRPEGPPGRPTFTVV